MRFMVTGCAGFIGSHLTEELLRHGHAVVGVDNFSDYYDRSIKEANLAGVPGSADFQLLETDVADLTADGLADADLDGIFHLAAQAGVRGSWGSDFSRYVHDNLLASQRIFEVAAAREIRCVFASSSSVYGNLQEPVATESTAKLPISPYGVTKLACESLAAAYGVSRSLDFVGLRYFTVYGPRQRPDMAFARIASALSTGTEFAVFGSGKQSRDFTYVADAVDATIRAMTAAPAQSIYNVGGGEEATLLEVIGLFEEHAGTSLRWTGEAVAAGDVNRTSADTSLLRGDTGWQPQTSLRDGTRRHYEAVAG